MTENMHPHPEERRRQEDNRVAARIAFSPYSNIAHLATTASLLLTIVIFGARFYSEVQSTQNYTEMHNKTISKLESRTSKLDVNVSSLRSKVRSNSKDIDRVEEQAAEDRGEIIRRLDNLNKNVNELNRYLRNEAAKKEKISYTKEANNGS